MLRKLTHWILKSAGWRVVVTVPDLPKCVICVAPHTSNWDFILGKLAYLSVGRRAGFLMKKEWFFFPLSLLFKAMGGVPVYRSKKRSLVEQLVQAYRTHDRFAVAITPEGTRRRNPEWKKGFYYVALQAQVPIVLAYIDYARKEIGLTRTFTPTGDENADMALIKEFYRDKRAKFPDRFAV